MGLLANLSNRSQNVGRPDYPFLESVFHKLLLNFTWWINRKDASGSNIFEGGFLGLDNIGIFDRSAPLPTGGYIEQSDGTSWMAMFCLNMLKIALELATKVDPIYEDVASKFFEHFLYIAHAMNGIDGGLWDETDGFFYDSLRLPDGSSKTMRLRSMVGLIPIFAVDTIEPETIQKLPGFHRRMTWFMKHRPDLCGNLASLSREGVESRRLLSVLVRSRLIRVLERMLDETEFLSPHGIRSISKFHEKHPFSMTIDGQEYRFITNLRNRKRVYSEELELARAGMVPGELPAHRIAAKVPTLLWGRSAGRISHWFGKNDDLAAVAGELSRRLSRIFLRDAAGRRPVFGGAEKFQTDPHFRDNLLFYEYFHGDNAAGIGANHQTGWTALVAKLLQQSGE